MFGDLGIALILYIVAIIYIHNNNKDLLKKYSNSIPVLALACYYFSSTLIHG